MRFRLLQIERDSGSDAARSTTWLMPGERDSVFSTAASLVAVTDLDLRLGEICGNSAPDDHPVITIFFKENDSGLPGCHTDGSVLLFGVLLMPMKRKVEYLGSVLVNAETKLHTVCFTGLCGLDERLASAECAFFVVQSEHRLSQIRAFQQSVKNVRDRCLLIAVLTVWLQSGLTAGSVVVIRPLGTDETVTATSVGRELSELHGRHTSLSDASHTTSSVFSDFTVITTADDTARFHCEDASA